LYYEFNSGLVDASGQPTNLKCAVFADIHTAAEKTNKGGQQLLPPPAGTTYITDSSGWALKSLADPDTPDGYQFVFGPIDAANNSPGVSSNFDCLIQRNTLFIIIVL
jgi:hypothetical protein